MGNKVTVFFSFLLTAVIVFSGCSTEIIKVYTPVQSSSSANYKTFTADNATPQFSFEYPSNYELRLYKTDSASKQTSVKFTVSSEEEEKGNIGYLEINVDDEFKFTNTASNCRLKGTTIQQDVRVELVMVDSIFVKSTDIELVRDWRITEYAMLNNTRDISDYILLEKIRANIGKIRGWEVVFSFTELPLKEHKDDTYYREINVPVISRYFYFKYQDMVWEVLLYGAAANNAENKEIYEHVIESLNILN